jgi:hypothetical protein
LVGYVRQSQQLEAETVFAGLRIAFAVTALDEAAQDSKHRRLGQPYCGHDLPEAQRRLRVADGRRPKTLQLPLQFLPPALQ